MNDVDPTNVQGSANDSLRARCLRFFAALQRPWVTVACALLLMVGLVVRRPGGIVYVDRSGVARPAPGEANPLALMAVVRDGNVEISADLDHLGSEGDLWTDAAAGKVIVTQCWAVIRDEYNGRLGYTSVVHRRGVLIPHHGVSQSDRALISEAVIRYLEKSERADVRAMASRLRECGESYISDWRLLGYLYNTVVLVAACLGLFSLNWIRDVPAWWRERRRAVRLARGQCPACRYPLAGLVGIAQCPECGTRIDT